MRSLRLFLFAACLLSLTIAPSRAEKFSSSLRQDIGSSISDQAVPIVPQLPSQVSGTKMPSTDPPIFSEASSPAPEIPPAPPVETAKPFLSNQGQNPTLPTVTPQNPGFNSPTASSLKNPFEVQPTKISKPDFEAKFKKLQEQQQQQEAEERIRKKKKLSESIGEELKNYGLFFLLGLAAILLVYALRKDAPAPKPVAKEPKELIDAPRDIWKEDF